MSKKIEPKFTWHEETGTAMCRLVVGDNAFIASAMCAEEDKDMQSEKVGCYIAFTRAQIKYLKHLKNNDAMPRLRALNQYYYSINKSKHFNQKGYHEKMLYRQIRFNQEVVDTINNMLVQKEQELDAFLKDKEKFYESVRRNRKANNS